MKHLRKRVLEICNLMLPGLLILLGFSGCDITTGADEYGTPYANYSIKGKVTDKETGEVLPASRVIIRDITTNEPSSHLYYSDTIYTGDKGEYEQTYPYAWPNSIYRVVATGADKLGNTAHKADSVKVDMSNATRANGGWYRGEATREVDIELSKKVETEE